MTTSCNMYWATYTQPPQRPEDGEDVCGMCLTQCAIGERCWGCGCINAAPAPPSREVGDAEFWANRLEELFGNQGMGAETIKRCAQLLRLSATHTQPPVQPARDGVMEMRICEIDHVVLKPNQTYVFTIDPNCEGCRSWNSREDQPPQQADSVIDPVIENILHGSKSNEQAAGEAVAEVVGTFLDCAAIKPAFPYGTKLYIHPPKSPVVSGEVSSLIDRMDSVIQYTPSAERTTLNILLNELRAAIGEDKP